MSSTQNTNSYQTVQKNKSFSQHNGKPKNFLNKNNNNFNNTNGYKQNNNTNNKNKQRAVKKNSRTLFVSNIHMGDLDGDNTLAHHYKTQRMKYLKETLNKFGKIEQFDNQIDTNGTVFVTYETSQFADEAFAKLKDRENAKSFMDRIKEKLEQKKLSLSFCPEFDKYKYGFSNQNQVRKPKNALPKQSDSDFVNIVTKTIQPKQQTTPKEGKKNKPKKTNEKVTDNKPKSQKPPVEEKKIIEEKQKKSEDLRREAEVAHLKDELKFFKKQQETVKSELEHEKERLKSRDERILKLKTQLERVEEEKNRLEKAYDNENKYKQKGVESIEKLEEELNHLREEEENVEKRLSENQSN